MTMAEEKKKTTRKPGRPRKPQPKKENRGGRREGAGRKKGTMLTYPDEPLSGQVVIRIRQITQDRIRQLRELTKGDAVPFNRMFESWVADLAKDYGIE